MPRTPHRRLSTSLMLVAGITLALAACSTQTYPNSTFTSNSDLNIDINALWDRILILGTGVFVVVEGLLIYVILRYRAKPNAPLPKPVHGSHKLEIVWTLIPVLILIPIAVPTVRTIFKTQAPAVSDALQVEVYGHQWWWEFRYPGYGVVTANELYLPAGRTVNFTLQTRDVIHSFWTPGLAGKRDLISNKVNHLWYTPDKSLAEDAFNGFCAEYCGESHANMRFRVYTVAPGDFEKWAAHMKAPAAGSPAALAALAAADSAARRAPRTASVIPTPAPAPAVDAGYVFPAAKLGAHNIPRTPFPAGLTFDAQVLAQGNAARGHDLLTNPANLGKATCLTCHVINGEKAYVSDDIARGPNLTHVASRHTFGGGIFPMDAMSLAHWVKNAELMKPGAAMTVFGIGQYSPLAKSNVKVGLTDPEIADVVAYLLTLK